MKKIKTLPRLTELVLNGSLSNLIDKKTKKSITAIVIGKPIEITLRGTDSYPELNNTVLQEYMSDKEANSYVVLNEKFHSHTSYDSHFHDSTDHLRVDYLIQFFKI
ncbi:MAG: hypothetical protein WC781_04395 [Candidatus Pacearchaeota archaeon]|jgi:hypothetical protein